ncbi:MAG: bacillithiol biosynthesis BshC, partial [Ferruginibacter sp.]|nr:bacillithiol biosynthesis BshC [Ferruginibacter sp.]
TLERHVQSLSANALKRIVQLEKKMFRARKRSFEADMRKIEKIKRRLFPGDSLQERIENFLPYYAAHGDLFIEQIFEASGIFEQHFCIISERE